MIKPLLVAAALFFSMPSGAVTVTFNDVPPAISDEEIDTYTEAGITFNSLGGDLGHYDAPGTVHLDDSGTSIADTLVVTTGAKFTPESIKIDGWKVGFSYELFDPNAPDGDLIDGRVSAKGVLVRGYRGSTLVAEQRFSAVEQPDYVFNSTFSKIDALEIIADVDVDALKAMILAQHPEHVISWFECDLGAPCSHFNIDSITINTSPNKPQCPHAKKPKKGKGK